MLKLVSIKIEDEVVEQLDEVARKKNTSRSQVIREAIELYLELEDSRHQPQPRIVRLLS